MPKAPTSNGTRSIAVSATTLNTNGSTGSVTGWVNIMIFNHGMAGLSQVDLTFQLSSTVYTNGAAWTGCVRDDAHNRVVCTQPAPDVGKTAVYGYRFSTDLGQRTSPTVTVEPRGASDVDQSDNTATLDFCTNGCGDSGPWTDLWVTAGKLATSGTSGTVNATIKVTVGNRGPAELDQVLITFLFSDAVQPSGDFWKACYRYDPSSTITCFLPAPPIGGSRTYTFTFAVDLGKPTAGLKLEAAPDQTMESAPADNVADMVVCTTAC
jgi:hypothetical protein